MIRKSAIIFILLLPVLSYSQWPLNQVPKNGLVAYYPFCGDAKDWSGHNYDGIVTGAISVPDRYDYNNRAYQFKGLGKDQNILFNFTGLEGKTANTVAMWVKKDDWGSLYAAELYPATGDKPGTNLNCTVSSKNNVIFVQVGTYGGQITYEANTSDLKWHHYVWVLPLIENPKLSNYMIYQDGVLLNKKVDSVDSDLNFKKGGPVSLGYYAITSKLNGGSVDDIFIYDRYLSNAEIQQLFNAGPTICSLNDIPSISYIIPDIGTPGMNTYTELIGPYDKNDNFGNDQIYLNNQNDTIRVICVNPKDTNKIIFGPLIVSWNGKFISTQMFVNPDLKPNSANWQNLDPEFVIPIQVLKNGIPSNIDTFYIVKPQDFGKKTDIGTIGSGGGWGLRSKRGAMIVDSMILAGKGTYKVSTMDCNPLTNYNEGYLPVIIISKTKFELSDSSIISVSGDSINAGPGGGGGGHGEYSSCTPNKIYGTNGNGLTPGGGDIGNCNLGYSLNGTPGGLCPKDANSGGGGGTGFPFSFGGDRGTHNGNCAIPAEGMSGGSGGADSPCKGGGGGGNSTSGGNAAGCSISNGGCIAGNAQLIPQSGGSGGAGGNGFKSNFSGNGGGGGGALTIYAKQVNFYELESLGADGESSICTNSGCMSSGGGGAGGGIIITTKTQMTGKMVVDVSGGSGGKGLNQGGYGGAGRVRVDGPNALSTNNMTAKATFYNGPCTDTTSYVNSNRFKLSGTGNGQLIRIYLKGKSTDWFQYSTVNSSNWSQDILLPGNDSVYYVCVVQQVPNPDRSTYTSEPDWVLSQAGANIIRVLPADIILPSIHDFGSIICSPTKCDTIKISNNQPSDFIINNYSIIGVNSKEFSLSTPKTFPDTIKKGTQANIIICLNAIGVGSKSAKLILYDNNAKLQDTIELKANVNSLDWKILSIASDTIDFGILCPAEKKDRTFIIRSLASIDTNFILTLGTPFCFYQNSNETQTLNLRIKSNEVKIIYVRFQGMLNDGIYIGKLIIKDICGRIDTLILKATVEKPKIVSIPPPDTMICLNTSYSRSFNVFNNGFAGRKIKITSNDSNFQFTPNDFFLSSKDSQVVKVLNKGLSKEGIYKITYRINDECNSGNTDYSFNLEVRKKPLWIYMKKITQDPIILGSIFEFGLYANRDSINLIQLGDTLKLTLENELTGSDFLQSKTDSTYFSVNVNKISLSKSDIVMVSKVYPVDTPLTKLRFRSLVGKNLFSYFNYRLSSGSNCFVSNSSGLDTMNFKKWCYLDGLLVDIVSIINLSPNPVNDEVKLSLYLDKEAIVRISLRTLIGMEVSEIFNQRISQGYFELTLPTQNFINGVYSMNIEVEGRNFSKMFSIVR